MVGQAGRLAGFVGGVEGVDVVGVGAALVGGRRCLRIVRWCWVGIGVGCWVVWGCWVRVWSRLVWCVVVGGRRRVWCLCFRVRVRSGWGWLRG